MRNLGKMEVWPNTMGSRTAHSHYVHVVVHISVCQLSTSIPFPSNNSTTKRVQIPNFSLYHKFCLRYLLVVGLWCESTHLRRSEQVSFSETLIKPSTAKIYLLTQKYNDALFTPKIFLSSLIYLVSRI